MGLEEPTQPAYITCDLFCLMKIRATSCSYTFPKNTYAHAQCPHTHTHTHTTGSPSNVNHQESQCLKQLSHIIILYSFTSCLFRPCFYNHQHVIQMAKLRGIRWKWKRHTVTCHQVTLKTLHNDAPFQHHDVTHTTIFKSLQVCTLHNDPTQSPV